MKARICIALVAGCLAALFSMAQGAGAATLQPVGTFSNPIYITSPPGDPRLFVVERGGTIEVVHDGVQSQFLDIHELTTEEGERGLLSMAFDPNYAKNGLFYVFYTGTAAADGQAGLGHVDEFHVSSNPNVADVATRRPVLTITRPSAVAANHNGGQLQFGSDGHLYISVGDGGTGGSTAPNLALLNGKILRIDPHGAAPGAYSIPAGNPYASSATARHEIWASGFRNPWRFSFDAATGDLTVGEVGEAAWEEIDLAPAPAIGRGANFGWPACEGFAGNCPGTSPPVFAYPHGDPGGDAAHGCAIMGGYVYRGTQIPELAGPLPLRRSLHRRAALDQARHSVRRRRPGRECARGPERSAVVRRGREVQPIRHERQRGGQDRCGGAALGFDLFWDPEHPLRPPGRGRHRGAARRTDHRRLQQGHGQGLRRGRLLAEANQRRGAGERQLRLVWPRRASL